MNVQEIVTNRFIEKLESGVIPWRKTWSTSYGLPRNFLTKKPYSGINLFLLGGFDRPNFLTYNQTRKLGGKVRRGAKSEIVVFWSVSWKGLDGKWYKDEVLGGTKSFILKYFRVFNQVDIEGIDFSDGGGLEGVDREGRNELCESFIAGLDADIRVGDGEPKYMLLRDCITVPSRESFESIDNFYSVLFHELIHWTGSPRRLKRFDSSSTGLKEYAKEELIAELGSSFLCAQLGVDNDDVFEDQASYLASWIKALKGDSRLLMSASTAARKASEFVLSFDVA